MVAGMDRGIDSIEIRVFGRGGCEGVQSRMFPVFLTWMSERWNLIGDVEGR